MDRRRIHRLFLLSTLISYCMLDCDLAQASPAVPPKEQSQSWLLKQKSRTFGVYSVLLSPTGVRINNKKSGVTYVAKAPSWDVSISNENTRVIFTVKFDRFSGMGQRAMMLFGEPVFSELGMRRTNQKFSTCGQDGACFVTTKETERNQARDVQINRQNKRAAITAQFKVSEKIPSGERAGIMLERIYGLPEIKGIPLEFTYTTLVGKSRLELATENIERVASKPADFLPPSNFRRVTKPEDVFQDPMGAAGMDNMIQNIDRGGKFNSDFNSGW